MLANVFEWNFLHQLQHQQQQLYDAIGRTRISSTGRLIHINGCGWPVERNLWSPRCAKSANSTFYIIPSSLSLAAQAHVPFTHLWLLRVFFPFQVVSGANTTFRRNLLRMKLQFSAPHNCNTRFSSRAHANASNAIYVMCIVQCVQDVCDARPTFSTFNNWHCLATVLVWRTFFKMHRCKWDLDINICNAATS